ncbi:MAG: prepilin-type N-terminal cleavage/methylation domain-containing protein [Opitutales bacterium]
MNPTIRFRSPECFNPGSSRRAFTLIELLTVIAIIGILAAILIPVVGQVREQAKVAKCVVHLRDLGTGVHLYGNDHNDWAPPFLRNGEPQTEWGSRVDIHGHLGLLLAPEKGGPQAPDFESWSGGYLDTAAPLICPGSKEELFGTEGSGATYKRAEDISETNRIERIGYFYDYQAVGMWDNTRTTSDYPNRPYVFDFPKEASGLSEAFRIFPHESRVNVLHLGGHVTAFTHEEIAEAGSRLNIFRLMAGEVP